MSDAKTFHDAWFGKNVEVKEGAFKDWRGVAQVCSFPRVEVAFPKEKGYKTERVWFDVALLRKS